VARNLFAALRELDRRGVDTIIVRDFGAAGLGAALSDRLLRAAEGAVVDC
jgi:L-threonylcarbamoyladenylate synthase